MQILESKSVLRCILSGERNEFAPMNTLRKTLLVSLFGLAVAVAPVLRAADSPAQDGLAKDVAESKSDTAGKTHVQTDVPKATVSPQNVAKRGGAVDPTKAIPILLIVFGCPVAIVGLVAYFRARKHKQLHETLRAMIEKGVPIPPELLRSPTPTGDASEADRDDPRTALREGLFLVALGVGICVWLLIKSSDSWGLGFIPFLIGLSFLAEWQLEKRNPSKPE